MKKILSVFALLLTCILTLVSCGANRENLIVVGTMAQPGEPILESIRDALRDAFRYMFDLEAEMNSLYEKMGDCTPEELEKVDIKLIMMH